MAPSPKRRFFASIVLVMGLPIQAWFAAAALAADVATNATPPSAELKLVAKIESVPAPLKPNLVAEPGLAPKPQPAPIPETPVGSANVLKVERVTALPLIKPKLQDAPLVLRQYVETK
jgi:hypothetical protein